jgi:D-3-phosphoglycerate dehydrogenase
MTGPLVVITDSNLPSVEVEEQLLRPAGFEVVRASCRSEQDVIDAGAQADALIVQWAPVTAAVLEKLERCRFVSRLGIGWDMIDVTAASRLGIAVANTPDYCIEEVAAHSIALALAASRGLLELDRSVRRDEWAVAANTPTVTRPSCAQFAVIGFGRIGRRVAEIARAIGYRVVVHDSGVSDEEVEARGFGVGTLEQVLAGAQVVSLHVPLTDETHHLIDARALARMSDTTFLVNTSRGGLIDEVALAASLHAGTIGGAALDVFQPEPLPEGSPLRGAPNLLLTPHAAWYSSEALAELPLHAARQVIDFFADRPLTSILNPDYAGALELNGRMPRAVERVR